MLRAPALHAINAYQRLISPRKGYGCAYRLAHGGTGCSGFAKYAIEDHGLFAALPRIMTRLRACKQAAYVLRDQEAQKDQRRKKRWHWSDGCDASLCCSNGGRGKSSGTPDGDCTPDCSPDCTPDCCSL